MSPVGFLQVAARLSCKAQPNSCITRARTHSPESYAYVKGGRRNRRKEGRTGGFKTGIEGRKGRQGQTRSSARRFGKFFSRGLRRKLYSS